MVKSEEVLNLDSLDCLDADREADGPIGKDVSSLEIPGEVDADAGVEPLETDTAVLDAMGLEASRLEAAELDTLWDIENVELEPSDPSELDTTVCALDEDIFVMEQSGPLYPISHSQ